MGYQLPNGSTVQMSNVIGTPSAFTAATNAADVELTFATAPTGIAEGDIVLITSAWAGINNLVAKVKTVATTKITLDGVDTTDVNDYPAGAGAGTMAKITSWVALPLITGVNVSGGDQQTSSFQPLQLDRAITLNTFKNGITQAFTVTHDSSDPIRPLLEKADKSQSIVAVNFYNPRAKETRLYSAQVSFAKIPSAEVNNVEVVVVTYALQSDMMFYKDAAGKP